MGILDTGLDPQTQGLLAAAFQGLSASGPSRMPVSLGQIIGGAGNAGLSAYGQAQKDAQARQIANIQIQQHLDALANEKAFRAEIATAKTPQERLAISQKYMGPDKLGASIQSSEDKRAIADQTKQIALTRLSQQAQRDAQMIADRASKAQTDAEKFHWKQQMDQLQASVQKQAADIQAGRYNYDTGGFVPSLPTGLIPSPTAPSVVPPSGPTTGGLLAPPGFTTKESFVDTGQPAPDSTAEVRPPSAITNPADIAAIQMVQQADANKQPLSVSVPQTGLLGPAPKPPVSVIPAAPNNLDARDLALRGAVPAPVAPAPAVKAVPVMPPEIASAPKKVQDQWKLQQTKPSIAGADLMNPETLRFTAEQIIAGDRQAGMGYARSAALKASLQNEVQKVAKEKGLSGADLAAVNANFAGIMAGSRAVGNRAAQIQLASNEALKMVDLVQKTSDEFSRTNFVPWNIALKAYDTNTGAPEVKRLGAAINSLVNVYARAINPQGIPTDSDKNHARDILAQVDSPAQVAGVLDILKQEMKAATEAPDVVRESLRQAVVGKRNSPTESAPSVPPPPPGFKVKK